MGYGLNLSLIQKKRCLYKSLTITGRACIGDICAFRKFGIDFLDRTDCCLERASVVITVEGIKKASILAMYAGADYIKTSTGKLEPAATPEAAYVMCQAIKEYYDETGIQIGFKPAGGINSVMDALIYYTIVKEVLGEKWLTNKWFRLGTSRLANMLLSEIEGQEIKFF